MSLPFRFSAALVCASLCSVSALAPAVAQSPAGSQSSSSSSSTPDTNPMREKAPSLVDPAGPTVSLVPSEQLFLMASALNACGYDEGLEESAPIRGKVRDELNQAFARSEDARTARDKLCLYIAQHRMTGTERDVAQYISLALYLTPPPDLETSVELTEMPPDAVSVAEILPALRQFVKATDLHGTWLTVHRTYDEAINHLHDPLSNMIVMTDLYLKEPAETYNGRRFVVVMEPMLSPLTTNARVYGTDYVVVVSPHDGAIRMNEVRHTYLHYVIEPLLYARANAIDRAQPILKEIRDAPLDFRYRSDTVPLTVECLIKAIEARTMSTAIADYKLPAGVDRSEMPKYERERQAVVQKQDAVRLAAVHHDMTQGFVLTQYFYEQLLQFEHDPASLRDTIGEMVYSMDIDQQVHRARQTQFDQQADEEVLTRSKPKKLEGLDLAEARLQTGDLTAAGAMARQFLADKSDSLQAVANAARANFILARVAAMSGHPDEAISRFQSTLATSKEPRLVAWSHIYLGRMLDLDCKRDQAVSEYKLALENRDGQLDTRLAAERGVKIAYAVRGHSCSEDDADDSPDAAKPGTSPGQAAPKPQ
jgi:predicted negative regulator of RcsB-dependent stress response